MIMPYGGGGTFTEDGAARHFAINGMAVGADMALSIGFEPVEGLSLGYSHRGVFGIMSRRQAFDTATMMRSMFGDNIGVPAGDEFLEGRQEMSVTGLGTGYTLGGTWIAPNDVVISGAYRSKVAVPMSGRFTMEPSMDMTVVMEGDVTTEMVFPDEFVGGLEIPLSERWRIMAEGGYVRWSHTATMQAEMSNIEVTSSDDSLNELLLMYGVSELDLIAAGQSVAMVMGFQDAPWAKVAVEHDFTDKFTARAGATYSPTSIPTEYLNAGNQDYNTLDAMLAGKWQSSDSFAMTFGVDVYFDADRTVTDSVFSLENDMATGTALPDASGVYGLNRYRVAVGLHYKPSSR
jgi:long-subunit fatty acid transport protein